MLGHELGYDTDQGNLQNIANHCYFIFIYNFITFFQALEVEPRREKYRHFRAKLVIHLRTLCNVLPKFRRV